jgi:hypothetical protein
LLFDHSRLGKLASARSENYRCAWPQIQALE